MTARGNERRAIFRDDRDRLHFLELLGELPERFGTRLHGWVLMDNHFHLLLETPEANLSQTGQWLNVSYSVWFNRRHQRSGHLFQGRFGAVLVGGDSEWLEVARYVHLNPVRVARLGLSKQDQQLQKTAGARDPGARLVGERLRVLRDYRWSSYGAYVGLRACPAWLTRQPLLGASGGRTAGEQRKAFEAYHEAPLREGEAGTGLGSSGCRGRAWKRAFRGRGASRLEVAIGRGSSQPGFARWGSLGKRRGGGRSGSRGAVGGVPGSVWRLGSGRGAVFGPAAGSAQARGIGGVVGRGEVHGGGAGDPAGSTPDSQRQGMAAADRRGQRAIVKNEDVTPRLPRWW